MRLPYSWLRDTVQAGAPGWDVSADELEQTLIRIGHEVEEIIPVGPVSGPLTVGRVAEIEELTEFKKPIRAVKVDVGESELRDIVCGATNFAVGDLVVVALPGSVLPGDFAIATRKTYGRTSDGMICSATELNLGTDHSGILVLPPGTAEPGHPRRRRAWDWTTSCSIWRSPRTAATACRCAAWPAKSPTRMTSTTSTPPTSLHCPSRARRCHVTIDPGTGVLRFGLRPVTGIDPTAVSPWWMQRRLLLSGIRAISPAVDVTNYVMLEIGHPMHAHDRSLITGGFRVRFAEPGETVRHARRHRAAPRPGRRAHRRRRRHGRDRWRDGCGHHRGPRQHHRRAARSRGLGSGGRVAHAAQAASRQRGRPPLRAHRRSGDFGGGARSLRDTAGRDRRWHRRTHADRLARRSAPR